MCTALNWNNYFGRTLDWYEGYDEQVAVMPRRYLADHAYAMVGMAHATKEMPLYFDAMNEKGLCMAGLNFPKSAVYAEKGMPPHWLIPYILGRCQTVKEALPLLDEMVIADIPPKGMQTAKLHWLLADKDNALVIEPTEKGLCLYDNPTGVLANEPPFPEQLSERDKEHQENSSPWRFARAARLREKASVFEDGRENISQFFHIADAVARVQGVDKEYTRYTCCMDRENLTYYYTTYHNRTLSAVPLREREITGSKVRLYPL